MKNKSPKSLSRIAVHEAGHAIVMLLNGIPIQEVSIIPEGESAGRVIPLQIPRFCKLARKVKNKDVWKRVDTPPKQRRCFIDKLIQVQLGGIAAELLIFGNFLMPCATKDIERATTFVGELLKRRRSKIWFYETSDTTLIFSKDSRVNQYMVHNLLKVQLGLSLNLWHVEQSAKILMKRKRIGGGELLAIKPFLLNNLRSINKALIDKNWKERFAEEAGAGI